MSSDRRGLAVAFLVLESCLASAAAARADGGNIRIHGS